MPAEDVDEYLADVPEAQRAILSDLRRVLAVLLPDAEQGIAYGVPCFKVDGKGVAGFGFAKGHCSYYPMSGSVTTALARDLEEFVTSKGSVQFSADQPLPDDLVAALVEARQRELRPDGT